MRTGRLESRVDPEFRRSMLTNSDTAATPEHLFHVDLEPAAFLPLISLVPRSRSALPKIRPASYVS